MPCNEMSCWIYSHTTALALALVMASSADAALEELSDRNGSDSDEGYDDPFQASYLAPHRCIMSRLDCCC